MKEILFTYYTDSQIQGRQKQDKPSKRHGKDFQFHNFQDKLRWSQYKPTRQSYQSTQRQDQSTVCPKRFPIRWTNTEYYSN